MFALDSIFSVPFERIVKEERIVEEGTEENVKKKISSMVYLYILQ